MMHTSTTTDRALIALLTTLAALVVGVALLHGVTTAIPGRPAPASAVSQVNPLGEMQTAAHRKARLVPVDVENAPEWAVRVLLSAGYHGDATDRREAIYAPAFVDVQGKPKQLVRALKAVGYRGDPGDRRERLYAPHRH